MKFFKNREKLDVEEQEIGSVARARAYGGVKKASMLKPFNDFMGHFLYVAMRLWAFVVLAIYVMFLIVLLENIGIAISFITVVLFIYIRVLRLPRKRLKMWRKIKRRCKKRGYRLTVMRGFIQSFKYADKGYDFKVDTGRDVYCVRIFTVSDHNSRVTFNDKNNVNVIYPCPSANRVVAVKNGVGKATVRTYEARGFGIMRIKAYNINFPQNAEVLSFKEAHNVLLVNLSPREMIRKARDGGTCHTGTGENMGDYTVYTAHDFLENLLNKKAPPQQDTNREIKH